MLRMKVFIIDGDYARKLRIWLDCSEYVKARVGVGDAWRSSTNVNNNERVEHIRTLRSVEQDQ